MKYGAFAISLLLLVPSLVFAQGEGLPEQDHLELAKVVSATNPREEQVSGTDVTTKLQTLTVQVLSGPDKGQEPTFENDFTQLRVGDVFYARHIVGSVDGIDTWAVSDPYRLPVLFGLLAVFLAALLLFGGLPGVRGLASLIGSLALIFWVLLPGIYAGLPPALVAVGVSALIIIVGSYITHGFNRTTTAAVIGMIATVLVTGLGAYYIVHAAQLSGFTTESNVYLNFDTGGKIDMVGLLFGGIMIGLLGVLYDISIGQAIAVEELFAAGTDYTRFKMYRRALRIGREHIGALVNTLAIAYVGASLPLLLLLHDQSNGIGYLINSETFATEIVRILIGSIGLILAVPITTLVASHLLYGRTTSAHRAHGHTH
jgi:uncharacterized membrane protein